MGKILRGVVSGLDDMGWNVPQVHWRFPFFNKNVHQQVNIFNKTSMNIFSSFIPNKYVTFKDKDLPWMTSYPKYKIHCKNSLYLKYLNHGNRNCDYNELQRSIEEVSEDISKSKEVQNSQILDLLTHVKTNFCQFVVKYMPLLIVTNSPSLA